MWRRARPRPLSWPLFKHLQGSGNDRKVDAAKPEQPPPRLCAWPPSFTEGPEGPVPRALPLLQTRPRRNCPGKRAPLRPARRSRRGPGERPQHPDGRSGRPAKRGRATKTGPLGPRQPTRRSLMGALSTESCAAWRLARAGWV